MHLLQAAILRVYAGVWFHSGSSADYGYDFGTHKKRRLLPALKIGFIIALVIIFAGTGAFLGGSGALLNIFNAPGATLGIDIPARKTNGLWFCASCFLFLLWLQ